MVKIGMKTPSVFIRTISILLVLTFIAGQVSAGQVVSAGSSDTLTASSVIDSNINPARSKPVQNDIAGKVEPGAIGNGTPLMELAQGKLPPRVTLQGRELVITASKLREAVSVAMRLGIANSGKIPAQHQARFQKALDNLVDFQNKLEKRAYLYNADVRTPEDYLLGFNFRENVGLSLELIDRLYSISSTRLAQYIFHECVPEKGIITERDDHRIVYNEIQSAIFGKDEVVALKQDLRGFINNKFTFPSIYTETLTARTPAEIAMELTDVVWKKKVTSATREGVSLFIEKKNEIIQKEQENLKAEQKKPKNEQNTIKINAAQKAIEKARQAISEVEGRIKTQNELAIIPLNQAIQRLKDNHYEDIARILTDLYPVVLPYVIKGQDESPIHHITHVVNFMSEIVIGENVSAEDVKRGVIAALLHDIGIGNANLPKITENMVKNEPDSTKKQELRQQAVQSRKEHMGKGVDISRAILEKYNQINGQRDFSKEDIEIILRIVGEHDNSKIPLMMVGEYDNSEIPVSVLEQCKKYLLTSDKKDWLMQLHWEADALWMLSSDGLLVDLQRQKEKDTPQNRLNKLYYNLSLHREVVAKVYQKTYSASELKAFGFHDALLYRSSTGYQIAKRLIVEREISLATKNLEDALNRIAQTQKLDVAQKDELKYILITLFSKALPYFMKGAKVNPVYHNTQVLDNMVQIGLGENLSFNELKNALIVALLHDIGNAISEKTKVKSSQIKDAIKAGNKEEAMRLAKMAIDFRLEHMTRGPELVREILKQLTQNGLVSEEDVVLICEAVKIHDNPSIEKVVKEMNKLGVNMPYSSGEFLFAFDDSSLARLITYLREADRLFMVSYQGVVKDSVDGKEEIAPGNIRKKLDSNIKSHEEECGLYVEASKDDGKFIHETLYRTSIGYGIFINSKEEVEKEIAGAQSPVSTQTPTQLKAQISEDLPVRAKIFASNLTRILAEHPDQLFFMGIETDIGESQKTQIMPIYKAIDQIENMTDSSGKRLFPNLMVRRGKAEELVAMVGDLNREGKLNFNNAFIGARKVSVDSKLYDSIKGEGRAWISAIDDTNAGDYIPVFEAITLNMMAYLNADVTAIKNFYDAISDKPIDPGVLQDMIRNRIIYILPKATKFDTKQLRELYELAHQVYIAA